MAKATINRIITLISYVSLRTYVAGPSRNFRESGSKPGAGRVLEIFFLFVLHPCFTSTYDILRALFAPLSGRIWQGKTRFQAAILDFQALAPLWDCFLRPGSQF
jgi:hypothetical protein